MKTLIPAILAAVLALCSCSPQQAQSENNELQSFADSLFQSSLDSAYIAGAGIIVFQGEEMLLDKAYGYASLELETAMPEDASFEIGSVTKQFTSAAILRLYEEGKLDLEDDFTDYVDFDTQGRRVTINHLLNHTSGIPSYTDLSWLGKIMDRRLERDTLLRLVEQHDFIFEPGEALIYNNTGYFILGLVIEKASGMSYEEYLQEEFFTPLDMEHSYYSSNSKVIPHRASGYSFHEGTLVQKQYLDYTWPYAAGSLSSSTKDLLTWLKALHGGRVLNEASYELMTTPGQLNDGSPVRYAMGLVNRINEGHREINHGGGIPGFLSHTTYFPEEDLYMICLVNTMGPHGPNYFTDQICWKLLDKKAPETVELDVDPTSFTGTYSGEARGHKTAVKIEGKTDLLILTMDEESDTLNTYMGNSAWQHENLIISFRGDKLHMDQGHGHLVLEKEE